MKDRLIIVSAPSGAGKSTLCDRALKEILILEDSISYTTRTSRQGEKNGAPYFFIDEKKFIELRNKNFFAEWAKVHEHYYGTSREQIESAWQRKKVIITDIDVQGAAILKKQYPEALTIFISPPSIEALRQRIVARNNGVEPEDLSLRLKNAVKEMEKAYMYGFQVINDDLERAYSEFKKIIEDFLKKS